MINLLPPDIKTNYRYSRRNVHLLHWIISVVIVLVGLGGLATYGLLTIHQSIRSYQGQVSAIESSLHAQHLASVQQQVNNISGSLRLSVKVLGQEVLFSKLLTDIGSVMPAGTELTGLSITQATGGINLSAAATDYTSATQIQVNLSDPSRQLFSKVDINSITCKSASASDMTHPCDVELRALFNSNNQFLLINQKATS